MALALLAKELDGPRGTRLGERAVHPRLRFPAASAHRRVAVRLDDVDVRLHRRVMDLLVPVLVAGARLALEVHAQGRLRLAPSTAPGCAPRDVPGETSRFAPDAGTDLDDLAGVAR